MSSHKRFDFTKTGGFPLDQDSLSWMQQSYTEALQAVASLIGDSVIVSGCVVVGNTISDGWVVLNGVLYPFVGGVIGDISNETITIKEMATSLEFEDANFKEVQFHKYCTFGTSTIPFNSLKRLKTFKEISTNFQSVSDSVEVLNKQIITGKIYVDLPLEGAKGLKVSVAAPEGVNPLEYVGFLNFGLIDRVTSCYYSPTLTLIEFYIVRESTNYGQSGTFDYVLIKKQH